MITDPAWFYSSLAQAAAGIVARNSATQTPAPRKGESSHPVSRTSICTTWEFVVTLARRGSPSEGQRGSLATWLAAQPEVCSYALGELFDGWHGPEEAPFSAAAVGVRVGPD